MKEILDVSKAASEVASGLYNITDDKHKKKINTNTGAALTTISAAANNLLIPIAVANFVIDKARTYLKEKFVSDLSDATAYIQPEDLVEPRASIAGPLLQNLAYALDEPDLKDMYLKLLASAMDGPHAESAHPAFIDIIKQCSPQDALLLNYIAKSPWPHLQTIDLHMTTYGKTGKVFGNFGNYIIESGLKYNNYMVTIDNLMRLGILKIGPATTEDYEPIAKALIEDVKKNVHLGGIETYQTVNKTLWTTALGQSLIINCIRPDLKGMPLGMYS